MIDQVLVEAYGADAVRYYFMAEIEFGKDGDFSEERFRDKVLPQLPTAEQPVAVPCSLGRSGLACLSVGAAAVAGPHSGHALGRR